MRACSYRVLKPLMGVVAGLVLLGCGGGGGGTTAPPPPVGSTPAAPVTNPPVTSAPVASAPAPLVQGRYDIGNPVLTTLFVSTTGNDTNDGLSGAAPLRTLTAAWQKVPRGTLVWCFVLSGT